MSGIGIELVRNQIRSRHDYIANRFGNTITAAMRRCSCSYRALFVWRARYPSRDKNRCRACRLGIRIKCTAVGVPRYFTTWLRPTRRGEEELQRSLSRSYLYTLSWLALVILESSRRLIEALEDSGRLLLRAGSRGVRLHSSIHEYA